jgi:hypothetical protein
MGDFFKGMMPKRNPNLESRKFDDEFVVLDTDTNQAHVLEGSAALVWQATEDGSRPDLPEAEVEEIVSELAERGLLAGDGLSRRTLLKVGAAGGLAVAGISSLVLPSAAMASSPNPLTFTSGGSITVLGNGVVNFTLIGGGGGAGDGSSPSPVGGSGGNGANISGTFKNAGANPLVLTVDIGGGGTGAAGSFGAGGTGGSTYEAGGAGSGSGGSVGGGGGGGASAILNAGAIVVVAGGGGGGGDRGTSGTRNGGSSSTPASSSTSSVGSPGSGDGGGGGGGTPGGAGGTSSSGGGAYGGSTFATNGVSFTVTPAATTSGTTVPSTTSTFGNGGTGGTGHGASGMQGAAWFAGQVT